MARECGHLGEQTELSFDGAAEVDAARPALEDQQFSFWPCRVTVEGFIGFAVGSIGLRRRGVEVREAVPQASDVFARAGRELAGLPDDAREGKALRSLANHREGLTVFVERPRTPMDNNLAERLLRGPVIGRRLSFGSDSAAGAKLAALMHSVVGPEPEPHRRPALARRVAGGARTTAAGRRTTSRPGCRGRWTRRGGANWRRRDDRRGRVPLPRARLHRRGDGVAAGADRRSAGAQPPRPVEGVPPASAGTRPTAGSRT